MTLAELSVKATSGEWSVCVYDCGDVPYYNHNGSCPSIQSESEDCAIVHWDGFKQEYWSSANGNQKQIDANAAFIVALVNAYRAGRLVEVEPAATGRHCPYDHWCYYCGKDVNNGDCCC